MNVYLLTYYLDPFIECPPIYILLATSKIECTDWNLFRSVMSIFVFNSLTRDVSVLSTLPYPTQMHTNTMWQKWNWKFDNMSSKQILITSWPTVEIVLFMCELFENINKVLFLLIFEGVEYVKKVNHPNLKLQFVSIGICS